ncbi:MAG: hypothetical protein ACR2I8_01275 [Steroidobacteraceae bacterium]
MAVAAGAGPPRGAGNYAAFLALYGQFRSTELPPAWNANFAERSSTTREPVDYGPRAIAAHRATLASLRTRLDDMNVASWTRAQQAEYLAVRAQFDARDFLLQVSRP